MRREDEPAREDYVPSRFVAEVFAEASRKGMQPGMRRVGVGKATYARQVLDRFYPEDDLHVFRPRRHRTHNEDIPVTHICSKCNARTTIAAGKPITCAACAARRKKAWRERHLEEARAADRERKRAQRAREQRVYAKQQKAYEAKKREIALSKERALRRAAEAGEGVEVHVCKKCGHENFIEEGRTKYCRPCMREYQKTRRKKNLEAVRAYGRAYQKARREKIRAAAKETPQELQEETP